jgi:hypothetical protein
MRGVLKPHSNLFLFNSKMGLAALLALSAACSRSNSKSPSLQDLHDSRVQPENNTNRSFDTDEGELRVVSRAEFERMVAEGRARGLPQNGARPQDPPADQLLVGLPKAALGKEHYFGGVITATDSKDDETLGGLKLTDMTPMHVYPRQKTDTAANTSSLLLEGCVQNCKPNFTDKELVAEFPIKGEDADRLYIDFSVIGADMNLVQIMDPDGEFTHLKAVSASTVQVSYSNDTLLFDVLGKMEEMPAPAAVRAALVPPNAHVAVRDEAKKVEFTTRWYLKKRLVNTRFKTQVATEGVGFFMTERFQIPHVLKHAHVDSAGNPIKTHYFIKNVPEQFKPQFKQAFEDWNDVFESKIGARPLTTEFVDDGDPLAADLVTGDVRVHVIEWDLLNRAGYGGLGPSIGDQETGSILSSNVLVQGPEIVKIYTEWFQINREVAALREIGEDERADDLLRNSRNRLFEEIQVNEKAPKLVLALNGKHLFNVNSQDPRVQDDLAASKIDFEIIPAHISYEDYMAGYFRELVGHELGHNMGLRHNFRGNLFASDGLEVGKQSGSIMEYLARPYRYKDRISSYDLMAIDYGYAFKAPTSRVMFCTDENVGDLTKHTGSAECSRDDAENDPYSLLTKRLTRARDLFIGTGTTEAPVWTKADMLPHFTKYGNGLLLYGESAQRSMSTWLRFFVPAGRPAKEVNAVKKFVAKTLGAVACEAGIEDKIKAGKSEENARLALENLAEYRKMTQARVAEVLGTALGNEVSCAQPSALEVAQDL